MTKESNSQASSSKNTEPQDHFVTFRHNVTINRLEQLKKGMAVFIGAALLR